ncbi:protease SohB [Bdellovibrio sp. HCB337]|uniref:protease SohB n=1 Tax=Bdellovibrio sp. HCB337 TaxID=3394358 RepID=UPI0039A611C2
MEFTDVLMQFGLFSAKALVIVLAISAILLLIALLAAKAQDKPEIEIELLHKKYKLFGKILKNAALTKEELKEERKKAKKTEKEQKKEHLRKIFVIDFDGDIKASAVDHLRQEITAVLNVATPQDEVVVRIESPGGVVHGYGLAASQLLRVREKNIPLTVCVDKVAASGGYLMSCTANKILCAPFAIVGSIGVVAQIPNFHRVLKKHDVDYKEYTAGEFKRTVSLLGEITDKGEEKFKEQLEATHRLFKSFVQKNRPQLDVAKVATGEYWYGEDAKNLGLVDEIRTSDDYLLSQSDTNQILKISFAKKQKLADKLSNVLGKAAYSAVLKVVDDLERKTFV